MNNQVTHPGTIPPSFDHLPTIKRRLMESLARIEHGKLIVHMDGETFICGNEDSMVATLNVHSPLKMTWRILTKGDLGFGESYLEGDWSSDDLTKLLKLLLKNSTSLENYGRKSISRIATNLYHKLRKNSVKGSRKNIQYHYDLGNDFYQLWLDESMTYSSALFTPKAISNDINETIPLALAQQNKYHRILEELDTKNNQTILEVGFGWGGFAEQAIDKGCHVHGITLSEQQLEYTKTRLSHYKNSSQFEIKDYRDIDQQYDHIVSIEMFEAVGEKYWQTYFEMLKRSLKPNGKIVLQIITIDDQYFDVYKRQADFIQRYIFPGGMLPSERKLTQLVSDNNLSINNRLSFGHDYGETLARWEHSFRKEIPKLENIGYDKRFQNMWLYYLAYCQAGFAEDRIDVIQLTLSHSK